MKAPLLLVVLGVWQLASSHAAPPPEVFHLNTSERPTHEPPGIVQAVVELALKKTAPEYGPFRIGFTKRMNLERSFKELEAGALPNLVIYSSFHNGLLDRNLDYVRLPFDMGLTGTRVCFTHAKAEARFKERPTLDTLKQLRIGQGVGWFDTNILRFNGFAVTEVPDSSTLLKMLARERVDMVCRGANELKPEYVTEAAKLHLQLSSAALYYELPRALWVNKTEQKTRQRIEKGLRLAQADGSLAALQKRYWYRSLVLASLADKTAFPLVTPDIDKLDPQFRLNSQRPNWAR
nr:transporter substrate-binding domain-containing protein [uncultured Rhodoferax sp.]